jgi:hypothetical protein
VLGKLRDVWERWRESRRQYQIERALYKMNEGPPSLSPRSPTANQLKVGNRLPRVEAPKGKAPESGG